MKLSTSYSNLTSSEDSSGSNRIVDYIIRENLPAAKIVAAKAKKMGKSVEVVMINWVDKNFSRYNFTEYDRVDLNRAFIDNLILNK
jgi:hypothetical protein